MLLVRNIRLPLTCPDPDAEAAAKALAILRVPARKAVSYTHLDVYKRQPTL